MTEITQLRLCVLLVRTDHSAPFRPPVPESTEKWSASQRNQWSTCFGMTGRLGLEYAMRGRQSVYCAIGIMRNDIRSIRREENASQLIQQRPVLRVP
jgi:hypothetical protein